MIRALLLAFVLATSAVPTAWAAGPDAVADEEAPGVIPGVPPGTPPPAGEVDEVAKAIGAGLRCPVCQGMSVADSTSSAAVMMQKRIRELVAAGYTRDDIETYFVGRYGEWVLMAPTTSGLNLLVWLGPLLAFGLGLVAVGTMVRSDDDDQGPDTVVDENSTDVHHTDPHLAALLAEVDDD